MEYMTEEQKDEIREGNDEIDAEDIVAEQRAEDQIDNIRETVSKIKETIRPSIASMVDKGVKAATGKSTSGILARDGVMPMLKQNTLRRGLKKKISMTLSGLGNDNPTSTKDKVIKVGLAVLIGTYIYKYFQRR